MPRTVAQEPAERPSGRRLALLAAGATALVLLALAAWAPRAEATFGANLDRPADNPFPCRVNPVLGIPWLTTGFPPGSTQSCSWLLTGNVAAPGAERARTCPPATGS